MQKNNRQKNRAYTWLAFALSCVGTSFAVDEIVVHNHTNKNLYGAVYYASSSAAASFDKLRMSGRRAGVALRWGKVYMFPHGHAVKMPRPDRQFYQYGIYDRDLYFSENLQSITPRIARGSLACVNVGSAHGKHYHLHEHGGVLYGYNSFMWSLHVAYDGVGSMLDEALEPLREQYMQHAYAQQVATIRVGSALCEQEVAYTKARMRVAQEAGEKLGIMGRMPRVALCTSGGGYRAMIATLGALKALEAAGLRDVCLYHSALSGSSWALAGLLQADMPIAEYIEQLQEKISAGFLSGNNNEQVTQALLKQYLFTQEVSATDFYGALIAQKLLRNQHVVNPNALMLCEAVPSVAHRLVPLPLYTAVTDKLAWVEFTPYEVGCSHLKSSIPLWAFGRTFFEGSSRDFDPPQTLGFCMGVWGSGMSANIRELVTIYQQRISSPVVLKALTTLVNVAPFTQDRIFPAHVPNWNLGTQLPQSNAERLTLIDAGIAFAVPLPPLLRAERPVDIIIVLDMSYNPIIGTGLKKVEAYAREHGLPFPAVDYSKVSDVCSVHPAYARGFGGHGPAYVQGHGSRGGGQVRFGPAIIYMPFVKNKNYQNGWDPRAADFTATFNFKYTKEQYNLVSGLAEYNVQESIPLIIDVLQQWSEEHDVCN